MLEINKNNPDDSPSAWYGRLVQVLAIVAELAEVTRFVIVHDRRSHQPAQFELSNRSQMFMSALARDRQFSVQHFGEDRGCLAGELRLSARSPAEGFVDEVADVAGPRLYPLPLPACINKLAATRRIPITKLQIKNYKKLQIPIKKLKNSNYKF